MKILFLTRRFYPNIGGVERHVLEISKQLIKKEHEVTVISELAQKLNHNKSKNYQSIGQSDTQSINTKKPVKSIQSNHFVHEKINIYEIPVGTYGWSKKFNIWYQLFKINKLIRQADVIHCHDVFFWYLPFRFIFPNKKVYTTFHGYEGYPIKKKDILVRKISEILSNGSICVGEFMKKWYGASPDYIIYGGVDIPRKSTTTKNYNALFFGRLDKQTGVLSYIRAEKIIKEKISKFKLIVYGDGALKTYVKHDLHNFQQNIEKKISKFSVVFVSRYLSILECLAAKRMVFAISDNPIKDDYLRMTPFKDYITICRSAEEIAIKVQEYYSNKKDAQIKLDNGFSWVKNQSWFNVANVYMKLWNKKS